MERILAFGPHPDDVEFDCAGTLALLAGRGYEIHIAVMAGGEVGSPTLPPQRIREVRLKECGDAAGVIGAHFHYAGGYDVEVEYNSEYRRRAVRVVREVNPLVVFTSPPADYGIDHEETSKLVRHACYIASVPNYDCGTPTKPATRVPYLYYWNARGHCDIFGRPLPLNRVVDVSSVAEVKVKMLTSHASQREWLDFHNDWEDYVDVMKASDAKHGDLIGVEAAEGFVQHQGAGFPQDNVLKKILGELCVEMKPHA